MAKILRITGIVIGAVLLVALVYLFVADFSAFKPRVEAIVSDATGREFRIDGDFSVKVLPSPTVIVEDVSLSNPAWADAPEMVRVGHFSANVGLWSLLFRPVVIHELTLHDVVVDLQANADGEANWDFDRPPPPEDTEEEEGGPPESPVDLRHADVSNVKVVYRRPDADEQVFTIDNFDLETDDDGVRTYEAAAVLDELPVTVDGTYTESVVDLAARAGDVDFRTTSSFSGNTVDIDLSLGTLTEVGQLIAIEDLPSENLSLKGDVALDGQTIVLTDIVAELGSMRVTLDGTVDADEPSAELNVSAEGPDLEILRPGLPQIPFALSTEAGLDAESVSLAPLDLEFGDSAVSATVNAKLGDVPALEITARSPLVDLAPFFADESAEDSDAGETAEQGSDERYVFKDEPLPLDALETATADVDLAIDRLKLPATEYSDFVATLSLKDGELVLDNSFRGQFGGSFENGITLTAGDAQAELDVDLNADGMKLVTLAGPDSSEDDIPASAAEVSLTATGDTPRALAASVNGRVLFMQGPGLVDNNIIGRISGDILSQLFSALNPLAEEEKQSEWECSVFGIDFESGLGTIDPFLLQGEKLMVVGGGRIDLNTEKLNIEFNTKPREGVGISADMFVTPFVALSGTLASPSVGLNEKGLLLSGGAAFLTGGMSFLYQGLADRATAQADQCANTFEAIGESIPGTGNASE